MGTSLDSLGRALIAVGIGLAIVGGVLVFGSGRVPWLGRLPGDLHWERDGVTVYAPLATGLLISVVLSVLLTLIFRVTGRGE